MAQRALKEPEAAEYISMSESFLRQSRMDGIRENRTPGPPFVKIGRAVRYLREDLDAWLEGYRQEPKSGIDQNGGDND
jgi:predicted DNA-binding transcriptional regulator AlpA